MIICIFMAGEVVRRSGTSLACYPPCFNSWHCRGSPEHYPGSSQSTKYRITLIIARYDPSFKN